MFLLTLFLFLPLTLIAFGKVNYSLSPEPIDVVIPYHPKDFETIDMCIEGIRENGKNVRRIIVVSKETYSHKEAEWFDESLYPFKKEDLALQIFHGDSEKAKAFLDSPKSRIGWIFQQFLKLYAPFAIPGISPNVLILDSDVIFLKPTDFMNGSGIPYFTIGTNYTVEYFEHAAKLLEGLHRVRRDESGIVHHMLFQRPVLEDFFQLITKQHRCEPWQAICRAVDEGEVYKSCLSEYEIYYNFVALRTDQRIGRRLNWTEVIPTVPDPKYYKRFGYAFIASQEWYRRWCKEGMP